MSNSTVLANAWRISKQAIDLPKQTPYPSVDVAAVQKLLALCPAAANTPLVEHEQLANEAGVKNVFIKDERSRMGLGSFKALGAAYVIAHKAAERVVGEDYASALTGETFVTASAGNHGLSVAAGARIFGAKAVIYLAETVPASFAERLRDMGADVRIHGSDYEQSMNAALEAAKSEDMIVLSDTSWEGYFDTPYRLMEGYLVAAAEAAEQMASAPSHIFLQAGVGGMAAALAAFFRKVWGDGPVIAVVEPVFAPALQASIEAGQLVNTVGPTSNMGRLDCKEASLIALKGLARDADYFVTLSDEQVAEMVARLAHMDLATSPSGGAGVAALFDEAVAQAISLNRESVVLAVLSEGPA